MSENDNKPSSDGGETSTTDNKDVKQGSSKTFTQEELGAKLSEERKKWKEQSEKDIDDRIAKEREKWEREAKMSEDEKAAAALKDKQAALDKRDQEITLRERRSEAIETLTEKGISTKLVDFVVDVDADKTAKNIETLADAFNKAVEEGVKAKLAGGTPKDRGSSNAGNGKKTSPSGVYTSNGVSAF